MDVIALQSAKADVTRRLLRRANTVVIFGDSITANVGPITSSPTTGYSAYGYWTWASRRLGHRLRLLNNAGVSGNTSAQILARFTADVAAYNPGYVVVLAGTNDGANGAAYTEGNLGSIYDKCAAIGATVIACTLPPLNSPGTGQRAAMAQVNQWIKRQAQIRPNFIVVDWTSALQDISGNFVTPTLSADGTHPISAGAQRMGYIMAQTLDPLIPKVDRCVTNGDDGLNLTSNPLMFGTAGSLGTGGTGTLATYWSAGAVGSGATFVCSQVACTDMPNLNWQQMAVSANGTLGAQIYQYVETANSNAKSAQVLATVGDGLSYVAHCEFETDAISSPVSGVLSGVFLSLDCMNSGFTRLSRSVDLWTPGADIYPAENSAGTKGVLRTAPIVIPANTAHVQVAVNLYGIGTVRIRRMDVRAVLAATAT